MQWGEGMWACVIIESTCVNVFSHRTYYNALFIVFFTQVSSPDEGSETHGPKQAKTPEKKHNKKSGIICTVTKDVDTSRLN